MVRYLSRQTPAYRRVMVFVEGGYLREGLKSRGENDEFSTKDFERLVRSRLFPHVPSRAEYIRTYYYDAIINETEEEKEREELKEKRRKQKNGKKRRLPRLFPQFIISMI